MFFEKKINQNEFIMNTMDELVPSTHLLRKIDSAIDFTFIYELVKPYYCNDNGRNCVDPIALFKLVFLKDLYGIKSMRETVKRAETDIAFRWFLNIPFSEKVPDHSTFSQNYRRRFQDTDVFENIFTNILIQACKYNLVSGTALFTDSTHIKANANKKKFTEQVQQVVKQRKYELEADINHERVKLERKPHTFNTEVEEKKVKVSTTDSDAGYYHRDEKEKGFMYLDHRTVDGKCNIIVDCHITAGNTHDSQPYIARIKYIKEKYGFNIEKVALDSGYYSKEILKFLEEQNIYSVIGYRRFNKKKRNHKVKYHHEIDAYVNGVTGEIYEYHNIDKLGYKQYKIKNKQHSEIYRRHIYEEYYERCRERRLSQEGKTLYHQRCQTVERSFADSKQNHGFRYAKYRGRAKMQNYTWLFCATQNMKKIAMMVSRNFQKLFSISKIMIKIDYEKRKVRFPLENCGFHFPFLYS